MHRGAEQPAHGSTGWPQSQSSGSGSIWVMAQWSTRFVSGVLRPGEVWVTSSEPSPHPRQSETSGDRNGATEPPDVSCDVVPSVELANQLPLTGIGRSLTGVILAVQTFIPGSRNWLTRSTSFASTTR